MERRLRALLTAVSAALVVACLWPAPAPAADPAAKTGTSLDLVPADAAFYTASLRNREQLDAVLKSKAYAALRELPAVKEALGKVQEEWKKDKGDLSEFR